MGPDRGLRVEERVGLCTEGPWGQEVLSGKQEKACEGPG